MGVVYDARNKFYKRIASTVKKVIKEKGPIAGALRLQNIRTLTNQDREIIKLQLSS